MLKKYIMHNIFTDVGDGVWYLVCYIGIPITVTAFSFIATNDQTTIMYLYITIFISALGSIYDMTSRYKQTKESMLRFKLIILVTPTVIIGAYCAVVVLGILITDSIQYRCDGILYVYVVTTISAVADFIVVLLKSIFMSLRV